MHDTHEVTGPNPVSPSGLICSLVRVLEGDGNGRGNWRFSIPVGVRGSEASYKIIGRIHNSGGSNSREKKSAHFQETAGNTLKEHHMNLCAGRVAVHTISRRAAGVKDGPIDNLENKLCRISFW